MGAPKAYDGGLAGVEPQEGAKGGTRSSISEGGGEEFGMKNGLQLVQRGRHDQQRC